MIGEKMSYPFPGMNPWLERPGMWRDVHHSLISALRDDLTARLAPRYFVAVETHAYVTHHDPLPPPPRYPDLMVLQRSNSPMPAAAPSARPPFVIVELPEGESVEEAYLYVRFVETGEVVTAIELLSHTNKRLGENRDEYLEKRGELLRSHVHFVEIDLLRAGRPMPKAESPQSDYRLFIRHLENPRQARIYPFNVQDAIPIFPLPLLPDDPEPLVDLGALLKSVYARARYDLVINYDEPPEPPLSAADAEWARHLLAAEPQG